MAIIKQAEQKPELKLEEDVKSKAKSVKSSKKKEVVATESSKSVKELRVQLQKLFLEVKTGKESNTSLLSKTKKEIARKLTIENQQKHNH